MRSDVDPEDNRKEALASGTFMLMVPWELEHPGGVNQVVANLYDQIETEIPGRVRVLVKSWKYRQPWDGCVEGRRTRRWRFRDPISHRGGVKSAILFWICLIPTVGTLHWWLRRDRVQVVNAHYPGLWLLPILLSKRILRYPRVFVISLHGLDLQAAKGTRGVWHWLWLRLFTGTDRIVACSEALAEEMRTAFPCVAGKVEAVTNGVDVARLRTRAQAPDEVVELRGKGRMYIACVATFEWKKGQDVLLEAFARLSGVWTDLDLVIAGRTGDRLEALRAQADRLCVTDRVVFLADLRHDQAQAVIRDALLFVLPSRYEPFGIVILEAGVHRVPVIASAVGGVPEIIPDERFGRLIPSDDVEALEAAISGLLLEPDSAEELAVNLERRVHERFTWQSAALRYLEIAGQRPYSHRGE